VLIFLLICFSWLGWGATLQRTALWVLMVTLIFHTIALASRIYIQGRPPVTNLYSSAIFIAWGVAVMCLGLELLYRNGFGSLMAATIGFLSLIIAHNLAGSGDTMQMMQAVLDTNIWLATHVVVVTLGYAATFLAGSLAVVYVLMGVFTPRLKQAGRVRLHGTHVVIESDGRAPIGDEQPLHKIVAKMVYGILCFAMLFSFVGTVLGGIWADQSWGRFWGWDPKENGAVLIVFWNALILHARWGGLVQARGMMNLTIFGNAVTSWSWFGTNMLGVGLHSYGFMDSAVFWLVAFVLLQFLFIVIGSLPLSMWRSFKEATGDSGPVGTPAPAV
jgi:ABC-type transport system involved in cytochrome c biogenesis permease subunit